MTNLEWLLKEGENNILEWLSKDHEESSVNEEKDSIINNIRDYTIGKPIYLTLEFGKGGLVIEIGEATPVPVPQRFHIRRYIPYNDYNVSDMDATSIVSEFVSLMVPEFEKRRKELHGY